MIRNSRFNVLVVILSAGIMIFAGLYINLFYQFKEKNVELERQGEKLKAMMSEFEQLNGLLELYNITKGKSDLKIALEHKLKYAYISAAFQEPKPEGYFTFNPVENSVMVFYTPLDNTTLQITLTIKNMPKGLYLPVSLQEGNALMNESGVAFTSCETCDETYSEWRSPVYWSRNVTSLFGCIDVEIPSHGWYTLSLTGPVMVDGGGYPSVDYMWGERDQWLDILSMYANTDCRLLQRGEPIYFAFKTDMIYGWSGYIIEQT
jgi:hypothetical protein